MPPPFPPGTPLVAYLRDSGGNEQDVSVERQRAELTAWAQSLGVVITRWFADSARSGSSVASREAFLQLNAYLSAARQPEAGVIIWEYARFARQFDDAMYYIADLRRQGYAVYSVTDALPDTLEGRLLESILAWKNAKYREDLSLAIRSGFRLVISAHQGYPNRTPPLGYRKDMVQIGQRRDGSPHLTAHLVPDPETAPLVQAAFEARAASATYAEIHNRFHLTRHHVSLHGLLRNPIYIGDLHFGGQDYPGFCPPLVSTETWQAAQAVNQARASRFGYDHPRRARSRFLLTGLLHCARCGSFMNGRVIQKDSQPNFDYYVCRSARNGKAATCRAPGLPKDEIEQKVFAAIQQTVLRPEILRPLLGSFTADQDRRLAEYEQNLAHLKSELSKTGSALQRIVDAVAAAGHSHALLDKLSALELRRDELNSALAEASAAAPHPLELQPGELDHALSLLSSKLRGQPSETLTVLRGLVIEVRAERVGGSPLKHRKGQITGEITLRLPLLEADRVGAAQKHIVSL
jgi:site-specific DNA recombinase